MKYIEICQSEISVQSLWSLFFIYISVFLDLPYYEIFSVVTAQLKLRLSRYLAPTTPLKSTWFFKNSTKSLRRRNPENILSINDCLSCFRVPQPKAEGRLSLSVCLYLTLSESQIREVFPSYFFLFG